MASDESATARLDEDVEVEASAYAQQLQAGLTSLLRTAKHADLHLIPHTCVDVHDVHDANKVTTLKAHLAILEARLGASVVDALESGTVGPTSYDPAARVLTVRLDAAAEHVRSLLAYCYADSFEPTAASLELLQLLERFRAAGALEAAAAAGPPPPLRRLWQLVEKELALALELDRAVEMAHAAAALHAHGLLRCSLALLARERPEAAAGERQPQLATALAAQLLVLRTEAPLQEALRLGRVDVVRWLLGADASADDNEGDDAWALTTPRPPARVLLSALDDDNRSPLEQALALSSDDHALSVAALLLTQGAPPDVCHSSGIEPLLHAVCSGRDGSADADAPLKASLLLDHGADARARNVRDESPLDAALLGERRGAAVGALVELLLSRDSVSTACTADGGSIVHAAAASRGSSLEAIVPLLGRLGVALEGTDRRGRTALHIAVASETSDPAALLTLLRAGVMPEARTAEGCSALELAVRAGSLRSIVALLQVGADANAPASDGSPLLVIAAECSMAASVALLEAGARVNCVDARGRTPLGAAVARGDVELAELLVKRGAQLGEEGSLLGAGTGVEELESDRGGSLMHTAVRSESLRMVRLLVGARASLSAHDAAGRTPLLLAVETGAPCEMLELLLASGAEADTTDAAGRSALEIAFGRGVPEGLEALGLLLAQPGVDVNRILASGGGGVGGAVDDARDASLLHLAAHEGDEAKLRFLLDRRAHVDVRNDAGDTPLHWACALGHLNALRILIQHGADVMAAGANGRTPLHAACGVRGSPAALALLIQRCERMRWERGGCNALDGERNTPLHHAARHAPMAHKFFALLLEHGADASLQNGRGQTVLHCLAERAVAGGSSVGGGALDAELPLTQLLAMLAHRPLALDAQETPTMNTALHVAAFGGCIEMATFLVELGAAVGLPNRDGFAALDSMQPSGFEGVSLQALLLGKICKPPTWTPDRAVDHCQNCKLPFGGVGLPFGGGMGVKVLGPGATRSKHHCRHCGRCVCNDCTPRKLRIAKFGAAQEERVCMLCERVLPGGGL